MVCQNKYHARACKSMRQAIKSYFNEQPHRRASKKNHKKKYYRQQIKIYTNNNLVVNLTNHQLEKPLKYILYKGLKFIPTPSNTHKQTIVNSFKRIRRSMYIHYHFRHFSKKTTQSIQNKQFMVHFFKFPKPCTKNIV